MDFNAIRDSEGRVIICQELAFKDGVKVVDSTVVATAGGYVAYGQPSPRVLNELNEGLIAKAFGVSADLMKPAKG